MDSQKIKLLTNYIKANVAPILVDFIDGKKIPNSIIIPANCEKNELNGHYEGTNFVPPTWLTKIKSTISTILVIDRIDSIPKEEQTKFIELLKYQKISSFEIPKNTIIIITAKNINEFTINKEIYSLVAHIKG